MDMNAIDLGSDLPRCIGTDAQDGGLVDVPVMSWQSLDPADMPNTANAGTGPGLANSPESLRTNRLSGILGGLPALILAAALCLAMASPALADFESAVSAYDRGDYTEARSEFQSLAAVGDERAQPYLDRISQNLSDDRQSSGSLTSTVMDSVTSIFGESGTSSDGSASGAIVTDAGPSTAARSPEGASGGKSANWEPWSPFGQGSEAAPPPVSDIVIPQRRSIWSTILHLPGDATVIGLQYAAQFLDADNLSRELQFMSRHSEKFTLSILAGFWWLVIIKCVVGIGVGIGRFMKAPTTLTEQKRHG